MKWPRFAVLTAVALAVAVAVMPPAATADPQQAVETRTNWSLFRGPFPSNLLSDAVLRTHRVRVVWVKTPKDQESVPKMSNRERREEVNQAAKLLEDQLPGIRIRIKWEKPVRASVEACTNPFAAYGAAHKRVPESQYVGKGGQHVAALVTCAQFGLAQTSRTLGSGIIWAGFRRDVIAHELGHTLGLYGHSGSLDCTTSKLSPRSCSVFPYGDGWDLMSNLGGQTVSGVWRDMILGAQEVPTNRASTWKLETAGDRRVAKPLRVASRYGAIYLDLTPWGGSPSMPLVHVRLLITHSGGPQQVLLNEPVLPASAQGVPGYVTGDRFNVPGTSLSVEIGRMTATTAEIRFAPK